MSPLSPFMAHHLSPTQLCTFMTAVLLPGPHRLSPPELFYEMTQ